MPRVVRAARTPVAKREGRSARRGGARGAAPDGRGLEELRASEERYALAALAANDGIWEWDLGQDRVHYSARWKVMLGLGDDEVGSTLLDWLSRVHADDRARVRAELDAHLDRLSTHFECEHRMRHQDGSWHWMLARGLALHDAAGRALRIAGTLTDVTRRRSSEDRLRHDAFHDTLTGLPNRALFTDRLGRSLSRARRHEDYRFAVVFFDLDRVKLINDSLGHVAGDRLLVTIARRLGDGLRAGDTAARIGGDEFAVLIDDLGDPADAIRVVTRLQEAVHAPLTVGGEELFATASVGIAFYTPRYERPEEMLRDADTAMYAAKAAGGARYQIFDHGMHERAVARLQVESALRRAVEREELRAFYQPVIDLRSGRLVGFEALLRWIHPERGMVSPADFIPVAEETGLIHGLGRWVMRAACAQMREWTESHPTAEPLSISVNVSGRQLAESDLVAHVVEVLDETRLDPRQLKLEITESALMQDPAAASERLSALRSLGVGVSVDDFGTGYSSLAYLHRLPLTTLKIDRTFVWAMGSGERETKICQSVVGLAHHLGLSVVAEGIETPEQRDLLRNLDCEFGQGFLFAKPLEASAAAELVRGDRVFWRDPAAVHPPGAAAR